MSKEYLEQLKLDVEADLVVLKSYFDDVKDVGRRIKEQENRLDKKFYLESQDILSEAFDEINKAYLRVKAQVDIAESMVILNVIDESDKKPTDKVLTAMVQVAVKELTLHEANLEGWMKATKNYLQTTRSHLNSLVGRESENDEEGA